jgi:hypothetical protein
LKIADAACLPINIDQLCFKLSVGFDICESGAYDAFALGSWLMRRKNVARNAIKQPSSHKEGANNQDAG